MPHTACERHGAADVGVALLRRHGIRLCSTIKEALCLDAGELCVDGVLSIGVLRHVPLEVAAELGRAKVTMEEILQYGPGSIIELDRTAGSPVDVVVNGSMVARGEVVVIGEEYGVRVTEILGRT